MDAENSVQDPYAAVLADLRAQRDKIDQAIALIESLRSGTSGVAGLGQSAQATSEQQEATAGDFLGMTIADAAIKLLNMRRRAMGNAEILQEFQRGGLVLTSADPANVVNSVITRRFNQVGDIVRVKRGVWGLQQWYPGRSFKKKEAANGKPETTDTSTSKEEPAAATNPVPNESGPPFEPSDDGPPG